MEISLSIGTHDVLGEENILSGGQARTICIDQSKCIVIDGQGEANYYFLREREVFDKGVPSEYYYFGLCKTLCTQILFLAQIARDLLIVFCLASVLGMSGLAIFNSNQYKATCQIIYDDLQQYGADNPKLVQCYILAIIYYTTSNKDWLAPVGFMGGKDECDW